MISSTSTTTRLGGVAASALNVTKVYGRGGHSVRALDGISANLRRGELTAVTGPAGSGKSTLVNCLAGREPLTTGRVFLAGRELSSLRGRRLVQARAGQVALLVPPPRLLPDWTVLQNILLPLELADGRPEGDHLFAVVRSLRIEDLLEAPARSLTTVQQQRVAVARSVITRPEVVVADTAAGALDGNSSRDLPLALRSLCRDMDLTALIATRSATITEVADRTLVLDHGHLVDDLSPLGR